MQGKDYLKQLREGTITSLYLGSNQIGDDGAKVIAEALKFNNTITSLDLYRNNIGAAGAKVIAEALKINNTLTSLDLSFNQILADGAKAIAEALKFNNTITSLDLYYNDICNEAAKDIAEALKINKTLISLNLYHNYIGTEGAAKLDESILSNKKIIYAFYDRMSEEASTRLEQRIVFVNKFAEEWIEFQNNGTKLPCHLKKYEEYSSAIKWVLPKLGEADFAYSFDAKLKQVKLQGPNFVQTYGIAKAPGGILGLNDLLNLIEGYLNPRDIVTHRSEVAPSSLCVLDSCTSLPTTNGTIDHYFASQYSASQDKEHDIAKF